MQPNTVTWKTLLSMYYTSSDTAGARALIEEMRAAGVQPEVMTWTTVLKVPVDRSDIAGAPAVTEEMRAAGMKPDMQVLSMPLKTPLKAHVGRSDVGAYRVAVSTLVSGEEATLKAQAMAYHKERYTQRELPRAWKTTHSGPTLSERTPAPIPYATPRTHPNA